MSQHLLKFQELLRKLFQFDCADLDFGIYRIMNHKRDLIEQYIAEKLPKLVAEELSTGMLAEQARIAEELEKAAVQLRDVMGENAVDGDGNLDPRWSDTPAGARYNRLQARLASGQSRAGMEATVFNHLYSFFSRYYEDGDFISKRRYSKRERYAIPYNGEEVHLHWANKDQYYVKTGEHFRNYRFRSNDVAVQFEVMDADVEQNNVKGEKRYFFPRYKEICWEEETGAVLIPFDFRPMSASEKVENGKNHLQEAIIRQAAAEIPKRLEGAPRALAAVTAERHRNGEDPITFLEYHLRQYTRRNTSDFFIHKDLKGFLTRELDFYLKNEVVQLDGLETGTEAQAEAWFQTFRLLKLAGGQIIDLLDQIESFQRIVWEKRKFVTDVQYCIIVGSIDKCFHEAIASCESQWKEWCNLCHLGKMEGDFFSGNIGTKKGRLELLAAYPTLVLDTRHFDLDFVDALLASFANIQGATGGLLVHSENSQALSLLKHQLSEAVSCIYIDPPYNTGQDEDFIYKDSYRHSSWMSMMSGCLAASRYLASPRAGIFVSTDDGEYANLKFVLDQSWGAQNFVADVIWNSRKSISSDTLISIATNHTTFFAADKELLDSHKADFRLRHSADNFSNPDADPRGPWTLDPMDAPNVRENLTYVIANPETGQEFLPPPGRCWRFEQWRTEELISEGRILFGRNGNTRPQYKRYQGEAFEAGLTPNTLWDDVKTTTDATRMMLNLFGSGTLRPLIDRIKPKPVELVERCALLLASDGDTVLDFFAGSGTTGHAVLRLGREDGLSRKFVLVEMGDYFDTVMLPRLKKAIFTPDWRDGKPVRMASKEEAKRSPCIIKYVRLESYEDALNNIEFDDTGVQRAMQLEDYVIRYMLKWETKTSATLLNLEALQRPFDYQLVTHANGNAGTAKADVAETFNYLIGLRVKTRKVYQDDGRRYLVYRGDVDGRDVVVIWRETEAWEKADYVRDKEFVARHKLTDGADEAFVNGASLIRSANALEPLFDKRMFEPLE